MDQRKWETMMRVEHVHTGEDFIALYENLKKDNIFYYRGQENECWNLRNALHRLKLDREEKDLPVPDEIGMIQRFMTQLPGKARRKSLWDILGAMQHYGIPTRMMDFTENFLVAAFFAATEASFSPCSGRFNSLILAINREIPKEIVPGIDLSGLQDFSKPKEYDISYHLYVHRMSKPVPRVRKQEGVFLFMHNPYLELASKLSIENNWFVMRKEGGIYDIKEQWARSTGLLLIQLSLSMNEFRRIKEFLNREKYDYQSLFPDVHGKVKEIGTL